MTSKLTSAEYKTILKDNPMLRELNQKERSYQKKIGFWKRVITPTIDRHIQNAIDTSKRNGPSYFSLDRLQHYQELFKMFNKEIESILNGHQIFLTKYLKYAINGVGRALEGADTTVINRYKLFNAERDKLFTELSRDNCTNLREFFEKDEYLKGINRDIINAKDWDSNTFVGLDSILQGITQKPMQIVLVIKEFIKYIEKSIKKEKITGEKLLKEVEKDLELTKIEFQKIDKVIKDKIEPQMQKMKAQRLLHVYTKSITKLLGMKAIYLNIFNGMDSFKERKATEIFYKGQLDDLNVETNLKSEDKFTKSAAKAKTIYLVNVQCLSKLLKPQVDIEEIKTLKDDKQMLKQRVADELDVQTESILVIILDDANLTDQNRSQINNRDIQFIEITENTTFKIGKCHKQKGPSLFISSPNQTILIHFNKTLTDSGSAKKANDHSETKFTQMGPFLQSLLRAVETDEMLNGTTLQEDSEMGQHLKVNAQASATIGKNVTKFVEDYLENVSFYENRLMVSDYPEVKENSWPVEYIEHGYGMPINKNFAFHPLYLARQSRFYGQAYIKDFVTRKHANKMRIKGLPLKYIVLTNKIKLGLDEINNNSTENSNKFGEIELLVFEKSLSAYPEADYNLSEFLSECTNDIVDGNATVENYKKGLFSSDEGFAYNAIKAEPGLKRVSLCFKSSSHKNIVLMFEDDNEYTKFLQVFDSLEKEIGIKIPRV